MAIIIPEKSLPTIAIVGRTNVGKSTLFNRLIEHRKALVSTIAGTTRTSNIDIFRWRGLDYRIIDTGGIDFDKTNILESEIKKQIKKAFTETDLIIFLVDLQAGPMPQEKMWAKELHKLKRPIFLVGNKADNARFRQNAFNQEWLSFGLGIPIPISAGNGSGTGDLLDALIKALPAKSKKRAIKKIVGQDKEAIRISLLGRPNVGKSSLFNALIGEERVIISPIAHTTRESHDTLIIKDDEPYLFMDTAGLRRQARRKIGLETLGVSQTATSLAHCDVALLLLDATEPFTAQDKDIINNIAKEKHKGIIVIINKWDMVEGRYVELQNEVKERILKNFSPLKIAPIVFISAKTGENVNKIFPLIKMVQANRQTVIEEKVLADFMKNLTHRKAPTVGLGIRHPRIYSLKQASVAPPTFEVTIKQKTSLHEAYLRYIENNLREHFNLEGTPVVVYVRKARI